MQQAPSVTSRSEYAADVYCPICTHTVPGTVAKTPKGIRVKAGQKCAHCHSSLDAGYVMHVRKAA